MSDDGIEYLCADHAKILQLYDQFKSTTGADETEKKQRLFDEFRKVLSEHAIIEEEVLYPMIRNRLENGNKLADTSLDEHQEVKKALYSLERMDITDPAFDPLLDCMLIKSLHEHIEKEENDLFVHLRRVLSAEDRKALLNSLEFNRRFASTHSHPSAPNTPPLNKVVAPLAAAMDKVMDAAKELTKGGTVYTATEERVV
eukprot:GEZU01015120.1.p1 GENE.GEZU01015120.1~~GEZU01015120.1.p1  ORF type:complete len:200 (-),score=43.23 GEZU01015120.1:105-704(-)